MVAWQVKVKSESHLFAAIGSAAAHKSVFNCKIALPGGIGNPALHADKCTRRSLNAYYCTNVVLWYPRLMCSVGGSSQRCVSECFTSPPNPIIEKL
jgi:hypothetical protein